MIVVKAFMSCVLSIKTKLPQCSLTKRLQELFSLKEFHGSKDALPCNEMKKFVQDI